MDNIDFIDARSLRKDDPLGAAGERFCELPARDHPSGARHGKRKVLVDNIDNEPEWFRKWILLRAGKDAMS